MSKIDGYPNVGRDIVENLLSYLLKTKRRIEEKRWSARRNVTAIELILEIESFPELLELQSELVARQEMLADKLTKIEKRIELIKEVIASTRKQSDEEPDLDDIPF